MSFGIRQQSGSFGLKEGGTCHLEKRQFHSKILFSKHPFFFFLLSVKDSS